MAMIRSITEYSSTVWDPHSTNDINTTEKMKRTAAGAVRHSNTSSVGDMLQQLKWPTLQLCTSITLDRMPHQDLHSSASSPLDKHT